MKNALKWLSILITATITYMIINIINVSILGDNDLSLLLTIGYLYQIFILLLIAIRVFKLKYDSTLGLMICYFGFSHLYLYLIISGVNPFNPFVSVSKIIDLLFTWHSVLTAINVISIFWIGGVVIQNEDSPKFTPDMFWAPTASLLYAGWSVYSVASSLSSEIPGYIISEYLKVTIFYYPMVQNNLLQSFFLIFIVITILIRSKNLS